MFFYRQQGLNVGRYSLLIVTISIVGALIILAIFDPAQYTWMPKCIFKTMTGYDCPGCGASRAIHALLHGHLYEALTYNYFLVIGLSYALMSVCVMLHPSLRNTKFGKFIYSSKAAYTYIVLFFCWWIIRNTQWFIESV